MRYIVVLLFLVVFQQSCNTMKHNIKSNADLTEDITEDLLKKHGNYFYIKSTYATFSSVWTYDSGSIIVYQLASGKIVRKNRYPRIRDLLKENRSKSDVDLMSVCLELDGDMFGFGIKECNQNSDFPVGIECMMNQKYSSLFFINTIDDIGDFDLWNVTDL